jgi:ABC-type multidrug transport system ATPase subunit
VRLLFAQSSLLASCSLSRVTHSFFFFFFFFVRVHTVLLLDEPTAALDSESEKRVVKALRTAMESAKSMVMVTHRLGVIRSLGVNRVIVLDKGRIVESGHPEGLLRLRDGLYASLAREQGIVASAEDDDDIRNGRNSNGDHHHHHDPPTPRPALIE